MNCLVSLLLWMIVLTACMPVHKHALVIRNTEPQGTKETTRGPSSDLQENHTEIRIGTTASSVGVNQVPTGAHDTGATLNQPFTTKRNGATWNALSKGIRQSSQTNGQMQEESSIRTSVLPLVQTTGGHHVRLQVTTEEDSFTSQRSERLNEPNAGNVATSNSLLVTKETSTDIPNADENGNSQLDDVRTTSSLSGDTAATEEPEVPGELSTDDISTMQNTIELETSRTSSIPPMSHVPGIVPIKITIKTQSHQVTIKNRSVYPSSSSTGPVLTTTDDIFPGQQTPNTEKSIQNNTTDFSTWTINTEGHYGRTTTTESGQQPTARIEDPTDTSIQEISDSAFTPADSVSSPTLTTEYMILEGTTFSNNLNDSEIPTDDLDTATTGKNINGSTGGSESPVVSTESIVDSEALESNTTWSSSTALEDGTTTAYTSSATDGDSGALVGTTQAVMVEDGNTHFTVTVASVLTTHKDNDAVTTPNQVGHQSTTQTLTITDVDPIKPIATTVPTGGSTEDPTTFSSTPSANKTEVTTSVNSGGGENETSTNEASHAIPSTLVTTSSTLNEDGTFTSFDIDVTATSPHSTDSAKTTAVTNNVTGTDTASNSTRSQTETSSGEPVTTAGITEGTLPVTSLTSTEISPVTTQSTDRGTSPADNSTPSQTDEPHTTKVAGPITTESPGSMTSTPEFAKTTTTSPAPSASTAKPPRIVIPHLPDIPKPLSPLPLFPRDTHEPLPPIGQTIRPRPLY